MGINIIVSMVIVSNFRALEENESSKPEFETDDDQKIIKDMREDKLVERQGSNRSGKWIVKK
ncbi:hypothetical protein [Blautia sp.]